MEQERSFGERMVGVVLSVYIVCVSFAQVLVVVVSTAVFAIANPTFVVVKFSSAKGMFEPF
jgi:hypothetical protein